MVMGSAIWEDSGSEARVGNLTVGTLSGAGSTQALMKRNLTVEVGWLHWQNVLLRWEMANNKNADHANPTHTTQPFTLSTTPKHLFKLFLSSLETPVN